MQLEADIERRHAELARLHGWFVEKIMRTGRNGFPDRFYARAGRVLLVEWKLPGKPLSAIQRVRHAELRAAGVEVHTVDSLAAVDVILGTR